TARRGISRHVRQYTDYTDVYSGKTVSRRRSNRKDVRLSGCAQAPPIPEALLAPVVSGARADARTEPARRVAAEVHPIRDRLVHPSSPDRWTHVARWTVPRFTSAASDLLLFPGNHGQ